MFELNGLVAIMRATEECQDISGYDIEFLQCPRHKTFQHLCGKLATAIIGDGVRQARTGLFDDLVCGNTMLPQPVAVDRLFDGGWCRKHDKSDVAFRLKYRQHFPHTCIDDALN